MNKRMRELLALIETKTKEARSCMDGENKDVAKAKALLDEVDQLKAEYEAEKRLFEMEKDSVPEQKIEEAKTGDAIKAFGRAAKRGFPIQKTNDYDGTLNETVSADGGYTVPEDVRTKVEEYRDAKFSLRQLVRVIPVKTKTGSRTFKKRSQCQGFSKVGEAGKIGASGAPQFERISYSIDDYAGYMPVTNDLLEDSDSNVGQIVIEWLGDESRVTGNNLILEKINGNGDEVDFKGLDGIKYALNVTLGAAFKNTSAVVTNDDGLNYLDTLKKQSNSNEYLLSPDPAVPMKMRLNVGATTVPLEVIPNSDMPSTPTYSASEDTSVAAGKTYYTRSGSGTDQSPYVYTAVASPTGNPSTSSYYEMDAFPKIPFVVGDLKEGIAFWDRKKLSIALSTTAAVTGFNAFEQNLTLFRGIEREDVTVRDAGAFVHGFIQPEE